MNKILKILWAIILGGGIFIAIHFFKVPGSSPVPPVRESVTVIEEVPISFDINNKNYSQLVEEGDNYFSVGNYEKAIENYVRAVELDSRDYQLFVRLGDSYLQNNQAPQAKLEFEKALRLNPDSVDVQLSIAQANLNLKDIDSAKEIIWALDEEDPQVKYYRGIILVLAKEFDKAWAIFSQVGDDKSKKFVESFDLFSHFREADPLYLNMLLAKNLTDVGQYHVAIPFLFDILNQKNSYRDAWIVLGYAYLKTGEAKEAIDALNQAKVFAPRHPQVLFYLGLANFAQNKIDSAISYMEAADRAGYTPRDHLKLRLGDLYLAKKNYQSASDNYKAVVNLNPRSLEVFVRIVWLNIDELNNPSEALRFAEQALEEHPDNAMSYNLMGWAHTAAGNYTVAEEYLRKALSLKEDFDAVHLNLGWMYEKKGDYDRAKEYYKEAYILGQGNSIGNKAAMRFNELVARIDSLKSN
jgi:tetratricopeptide (TPR) repeat protein